MIVYANNIHLEPEDGVVQVIKEIAKWASIKTRFNLDIDRLSRGIRELKFKDGSVISSVSTIQTGEEFPFLFSFQYAHKDRRVSGRRWITEIGIRQSDKFSSVECSCLLRTEDMSTRVTAPVPASRPRLLVDLFESCRPIRQTPGLFLRELNSSNANDFKDLAESRSRRQPLIIMSPDDQGNYLVDPEKMRLLVVGLADVYVIRSQSESHQIGQQIDRSLYAFKGACRIIFQKRSSRQDEEGYLHSNLIQPGTFAHPEFEILALVTHKRNVPLSWTHISSETVSQWNLRKKVHQAIKRSKNQEIPLDISEYIELLEATDHDLRIKDSEISALRDQIEDADFQISKLSTELEGARHALSYRSSSYGTDQASTDMATFREYFQAAIRGDARLEQVLHVIDNLYSDRLVVLDSAYASAKAADKAGFKFADKARDMLDKLASSYWEILSEGGSDQQAKDVFGRYGYAANDAMVSSEGRKARTFLYKGQSILMERHLRLNYQESNRLTLRIHFQWIADEKKIVIGHCGKHLQD